MTKLNQEIEKLYLAILTLKNIEEARMFFRDLLTEKELKELSNRWKAASMLADKIPYSKIEKETGLSSRTIARVSKWLNRGKKGFSLILNRKGAHHHNSSPNSARKEL